MAEGSVSSKFGYGNLAESPRPRPGGGSLMIGPKSVAAPFQGTPDEPIGIQPAGAPAGQQKSGGGGGGGIIGRGLNFLKGMGEGGGEAGAGEAAAGGAAEAGGAAGVGELAELAPLALAAL